MNNQSYQHKILILINDITKIGGSERTTILLANLLSQRIEDIEILSLVPISRENLNFELNPSVTLSSLNLRPRPLGLFSKSIWYISYIKKLFRHISKKETTHMIGTGHYVNWILTLYRLVDSKVISIGCEHVVFSSLPSLSRLIIRTTYRWLDHVVVLSESAKKSLSNYSNCTVIPNALPFNAPTPTSLEEKRILMVGRISKEKGLDRLCPIIDKIKEDLSQHRWRLRIVGDGDIKPSIEKLFYENQLAQFVDFIPFTNNVLEEYIHSSIYIMTSYSEAFPMVLLEAKAVGLPVIAYNCPEGPSEIIHDKEDGFLIENGDSDSFAEAIKTLIEDKVLRKKMGSRAIENVDKYSQYRVLESWLRLLEIEN